MKPSVAPDLRHGRAVPPVAESVKNIPSRQDLLHVPSRRLWAGGTGTVGAASALPSGRTGPTGGYVSRRARADADGGAVMRARTLRRTAAALAIGAAVPSPATTFAQDAPDRDHVLVLGAGHPGPGRGLQRVPSRRSTSTMSATRATATPSTRPSTPRCSRAPGCPTWSRSSSSTCPRSSCEATWPTCRPRRERRQGPVRAVDVGAGLAGRQRLRLPAGRGTHDHDVQQGAPGRERHRRSRRPGTSSQQAAADLHAKDPNEYLDELHAPTRATGSACSGSRAPSPSSSMARTSRSTSRRPRSPGSPSCGRPA